MAIETRQERGMGTFTVPVEFGTPDRSRFEAFDAVADSGAHYSWLPTSALTRLGHQPDVKQAFTLADGSEVERDVGEVIVRLEGRVLHTLCVFGEEKTPPILGALAMEQFLVMPDPVHKRLVPVKGLALMAQRGKKYMEAAEKVDRSRMYEPDEAIGLLKEITYTKFDETVELHIRTGLDTRHARCSRSRN